MQHKFRSHTIHRIRVHAQGRQRLVVPHTPAHVFDVRVHVLDLGDHGRFDIRHSGVHIIFEDHLVSDDGWVVGRRGVGGGVV